MAKQVLARPIHRHQFHAAVAQGNLRDEVGAARTFFSLILQHRVAGCGYSKVADMEERLKIGLRHPNRFMDMFYRILLDHEGLHHAVSAQVPLAEFALLELGLQLRRGDDERHDGVVSVLEGIHRGGHGVPVIDGNRVLNPLVLDRIAEPLHRLEELIHYRSLTLTGVDTNLKPERTGLERGLRMLAEVDEE